MAEPALELTGVTKEFQKGKERVKAVDSVSLKVEKGEMIVFLGPSGCGKTTTLRMVAGFEIATSGKISIQGEDMTNVPVNKRGIGFVFQNYALFPHMSVGANVAYGLKARGERDADIVRKVQEGLELVGLAGAKERFPSQLSGGEQQRVALARVLVMEPKLLLMDEPLSNLDAKLRIHMRTEIRGLQKKLGITCLYVTHDQSEALTMADRVMVMNHGRVEQVGSPFEVYSNPRTLFVADFIGQANTLKLRLAAAADGLATAELPGGRAFEARVVDGAFLSTGQEAVLVVRPERIAVRAAAAEDAVDTQLTTRHKAQIKAKVLSSTFIGSHMEYLLGLAGGEAVSACQPFTLGDRIFAEGEEVLASFSAGDALFLPA